MNWNNFRRVLRPLFLIIGLLFFVALVITNWNQAQLLFERINWFFFALSIIFAVCDNVVFSVVFYWLLGKYRLPAAYPVVGEMFFLGQLAKYIPGRFWSFVYQATYFDRPQASVAILFANLELTAVSIIRGLIIGGLLIIFSINLWGVVPIFLIGLLGFVWILQVEWIPKLVNRIRAQKYQLADDVASERIRPAPIVVVYLLTILFYLSANYMLLVYGFQLDWRDATLFIAFFSISWVAGVVAFIMPAGIGVREAVFVYLGTQLNSGYSVEMLTTIAIVYRFWQIFHEVGSVAIGVGLRRLQK